MRLIADLKDSFGIRTCSQNIWTPRYPVRGRVPELDPRCQPRGPSPQFHAPYSQTISPFAGLAELGWIEGQNIVLDCVSDSIYRLRSCA